MEILISVVSLIFSLLVLLVLILLLKQLKNNGASQKQNPNNLTKEEMILLMRQLSDGFAKQMGLMNQNINNQTDSNRQQMEAVRTAVKNEMQQIRQENAVNLGEIRQTVDEKLENTLEKRLGESFNQVGARLEQVHQGLGEMQNLAANVGDLQKLLRNVKIRGTWGEVQLGAILAQILAPNQYEKNVRPDPNKNTIVEYGIKIPDKEREFLILPIDSKCPLEDYQRLTATDDPNEKNKALNALNNRIKAEAKEIYEKYISPPYTTDFAILFLPLEGLFAEVLQQQSLCETLQKKYKVLVAGPTTLAALLNVLQLGFQSLAIQARTDEIWELLGQVKSEFVRFGDALEKSRKKLKEADNALDLTSRRTRIMEKKLKDIETGDITLATDISQNSEN